MGRNSYNGGGTVVHAGSGFFSFKGGRKRKKKQDGSDSPGPARPGSICDFRTIETKRKKLRVVEFPVKTEEERQRQSREKEQRKFSNRAKLLKNNTAKAIKRAEAEVRELKRLMIIAETNFTKLVEAKMACEYIDISSPSRETMSSIDEILHRHGQSVLKTKMPRPNR